MLARISEPDSCFAGLVHAIEVKFDWLLVFVPPGYGEIVLLFHSRAHSAWSVSPSAAHLLRTEPARPDGNTREPGAG
jgi:hypothetical protein